MISETLDSITAIAYSSLPYTISSFSLSPPHWMYHPFSPDITSSQCTWCAGYDYERHQAVQLLSGLSASCMDFLVTVTENQSGAGSSTDSPFKAWEVLVNL